MLQNTTLGLGVAMTLTGILTSNLMAGANDVWLNELRYDDVGTQDIDMIEIAIGSAVDPCSVGIYLYNGADGSVYGTLSPGVDFNVGPVYNGMTLYWTVLPINTLQNGTDGIALTVGSTVKQFLSYEGAFLATDGPAIGMISQDIGLSQTNSPTTLGLTSFGSSYSDFTWQTFKLGSMGTINMGQMIFNVSHVVTASGISFTPASINVHRGDTVVWSWGNGSHTVTQGSGCSSGGMFNAPLNSASQTFTWDVPVDAPSSINYFCIPHCPWMVGVIHVLPDPVVCLSDVDGDGQVAVTDLLKVIGEWGGTNPVLDLDCDGQIGVSDLLVIISNWGPC